MTDEPRIFTTDQPDLVFENNAVGRLKKEIWEASDDEIDAILAEYGIPSPAEWGKPGSYIQTTVRWQVEENRPTPELANHRTPIQNLYATGGSWHVGSNCGSSESYNCYKIIASDLGLAKPWEEPGKEEPESLVEGLRSLRRRVRDSAEK